MVWWQGPPWCVLRSRSVYLWRVMDYATTDDLLYTVQDLPASDWRAALKAAKPGQLCAGAWTYWSLILGLLPPGTVCDWPSLAHRLDVRHRSLLSQRALLDYVNRYGAQQS